MSRALDPDRLITAVSQAGWNVSRSKAGRLRFHPPSGGPPVVAPARSGDRQGWRDTVAQLRIKGIEPGALAGIWARTAPTPSAFEKLTGVEREINLKQLVADVGDLLGPDPATPGSLMARARLKGQPVLLREVQVALDTMVADGLAVAVGDTYLAPRPPTVESEPVVEAPRWLPPQPLARRRHRHLRVVGPRLVWCSAKHHVWHATAHNRPFGDQRTLCGYLLVPGATAELRKPTCADCLPESARFV